jgi:hypothetical protein
MNSLEQLYRATPDQRSPAALDQQILQHAQQHAERRSRGRQRPITWLPLVASAAVACLALVLVLKPGVDRSSQPYAPPASADATEEQAERSAQQGLPRKIDQSMQNATASQPTTEALQDEDSAAIARSASVSPSTTPVDAQAPAGQSALQQEIAELTDRTELSLQPTAVAENQQRRAAAEKLAPSQPETSQITTTGAPSVVDDSRQSGLKALAADISDSAQTTDEAQADDAAARAWIDRQPSNAYTIQLAVARNLVSLKRDIARTSLDNSRVYFIKVPLREDTGYAALYGSWDSLRAAYNAAERIAKFEPWVRQFSELQ